MPSPIPKLPNDFRIIQEPLPETNGQGFLCFYGQDCFLRRFFFTAIISGGSLDWLR